MKKKKKKRTLAETSGGTASNDEDEDDGGSLTKKKKKGAPKIQELSDDDEESSNNDEDMSGDSSEDSDDDDGNMSVPDPGNPLKSLLASAPNARSRKHKEIPSLLSLNKTPKKELYSQYKEVKVEINPTTYLLFHIEKFTNKEGYPVAYPAISMVRIGKERDLFITVNFNKCEEMIEGLKAFMQYKSNPKKYNCLFG